MNRERIIQELNDELESLARLHIRHRLEHCDSFRTRKDRISNSIREHEIDVRKELDPVAQYFYRRYFE